MAGLILLESKVYPRLPREAVRQHVDGEVVMAVTIGTDGRIETLDVISGPQLLRETFAAAVKRWRYKPYMLDGVAQRVRTTIAITMQYGGAE
jgi:protein TonB